MTETEIQHDSDCAQHNEPAYPNGPCDCSALSPPAEGEVSEWRFCPGANGKTALERVPTPTPAPVDHIGDATEKVDWARCQRCGGEIQGWICQDCHQEFEENDASELVFCPSESVDWTVVGPKLVEALEAVELARLSDTRKDWTRATKLTDAALAAQPQSNGE